MHVPKPVAASVLAVGTLAAMALSHVTNPEFGYGPVFLLICAFGAWLVGNRFAIMLLAFIATIQILSGHATALHGGLTIKAVDLAVRVSSAFAVVLMLGVARAALEIEWRYARIDPLTGALNRKAFFEAVEAEADKTGMAVLVFADVDGLKRLNDRLGHEMGDNCLRDFADRVRKVIRKEDIFARNRRGRVRSLSESARWGSCKCCGRATEQGAQSRSPRRRDQSEVQLRYLGLASRFKVY